MVISRTTQLMRGGCFVAFLLLLVTPGADAQQRKRQKQEKKGTAAPVQQQRTRTPAGSGNTSQGATASESASARKTDKTPSAADAMPAGGPADLAQQAASGQPAGRTKRPAPPSPPLSVEQLQALNPYKREIEGIPLRGYAELERSSLPTQPIYAEGSLGMYMTAGVRAGAAGNSWPYDYSAHVSGHTSNGFVDNASRSGFQVGAAGGYIIDEGYGIFSGGHMGAEAEYRTESYRRYALQAAPERNVRGWNIGMNSQNSYNGTAFELNGIYRQLTLADAGDTGEGSLEGSLKIRVPYRGLTVGGEADLRLTYLDGRSISFGNVGGYAKYSTSVFSLRGGFSIGAGENSDMTTTVKIAPLAELNFFPLSGVTLGAAITGGLHQSTLRNLLMLNPYVVANPLVQHEVERFGYKATVRIEPTQSFALRLSGARGDYDQYSYFGNAADALFAPGYDKATITKIIGDFYWEIGTGTMVAAMATFMESQLELTGAEIPYVPKWDAELMLTKRLGSIPLTMIATARYIGERRTEGGGVMDAVPLVGLKGRYRLSSLLDATVELSNLGNARYELWPGYRERGVFGAVGIGIRY